MDIKPALVNIEGKPLEKLIETISSAIGVLYNPRKIRNEAKADAEALVITAKAKAEALLILGDADNELANRAAKRIVHQEVNRQQNIEEVVSVAAEFLGDNVSNEPVSEDWRTRFFNKAQDVFDSELQTIWGKILAEEVTAPGKVSLRTLDILSNLTKEEAAKFNVACSLALNEGYLLEVGLDENGSRQYGMAYSDLMFLMGAGLIHEGSLTITYQYIEQYGGCLLMFDNIGIICKKEGLKWYKFDDLSFTVAGKELHDLLNIKKDKKHLSKIVDAVKNKGMIAELTQFAI